MSFVKFAKSAGAVIFYRQPDGKIEYLLLNQNEGQAPPGEYWNFPKGTIEKGESEMEAAKREIAEETGLTDLEFLPEFRATEKYFFRWPKQSDKSELIYKTVVLFLAEAKSQDVKISDEHVGYVWLGFDEANRKLSFQNSRRILKEADKFLQDYFSKKSLSR